MPELYFHPDDASTFFSQPVYLQVSYLDQGYGRLSVTYKTTAGQWQQPGKFTRVVRLGTGQVVHALFRCEDMASRTPEVRIRLEGDKAGELVVTAVTTQGEPWPDEHFRYLLDEAWRRPYLGPSAPNGNGTLRGKVMAGYQGWFRTPNDPYDVGWWHWGDIARGTFTVDMWPDTSLYPPDALDKAAEVRTRSGQTATLFSPGWPEVVDRHFALMRQYHVDGAFVQRFASRQHLHAWSGGPEWVLGNVRAAANREGRLWAVEYDVSGCPDGELLETLRRDWAWLVDEFGVRTDPAYAREGSRPVVFIWGMGVPDRRITPQTANAVVDFFQHDPKYGGCYVIGGVIGSWRALPAPWQTHIAHCDGVLAWQSRRYAQDVADLRRLGVTCYPHVWPGFSWANLKHLPTGSNVAYIPREGGGYYETLLREAVDSGADRLFVGMFDEYDEGTAILPMSDDPPPTPIRPGVDLCFPGLDDGEHTRHWLIPAVEFSFDDSASFPGTPGGSGTLRFEGRLVPPASGRYSLRIEGLEGDKATLALGSTQLHIDAFTDDLKPSLAVQFTAGKPVSFRLDYQHTQGSGVLRLRWEPPGRTEQTIPGSAYQEAWGRFLTNEGQPADRWLSLTGQWRDWLNQPPTVDTAPAATP